MIDKKQEIKQKILMAALNIIPFEGWDSSVIKLACKDSNLPSQYADIFFPNGIMELLKFFHDYVDELMVTKVLSSKDKPNKIHEKILFSINNRLEILTPYKTVIAKTVPYLLLPWNAAHGISISWRTSDIIWHHIVNDKSTDFNYYTKRTLLMSIYSSTIIYWLSDESDSFKNTKEFLIRQIKGILQVRKKIPII